MSRHNSFLGTLTIANGGTASNILEPNAGVVGALVDIVVYGPSALTGSAKLQAASVNNAAAGDMVDVNINGTDVALTAGDAVVVPFAAWRAIRVLSGSAEGAQRDFRVMGQFDMG